jgi:hypothetical protein
METECASMTSASAVLHDEVAAGESDDDEAAEGDEEGDRPARSLDEIIDAYAE